MNNIPEEILKKFEDLSHQQLPGTVLTNILRVKAQKLSEQIDDGQIEDEQNLILHLVESHTPGIRQKLQMERDGKPHQKDSELFIMNEEHLCFSNSNPLNLNHLDIDVMRERIAEMPKEWTIVQITPHFSKDNIYAIDSESLKTYGVFLTVFNCGQKEDAPYCISDYYNYVTIRENLRYFKKQLKESLMNVEKVKTGTNSYKKFFITKGKLADDLETLIHTLENELLSGWQNLFVGKYVDQTIEPKIVKLLNEFIAENDLGKLSKKNQDILVQVVKGTSAMSCETLRYRRYQKVLAYCFPENNDINIEIAWRQFWKEHNFLTGEEERHPVILIIDETLDSLPWEMIEVLVGQPCSRMPSFHTLYALFKANEDTIKDGYKCISNYEKGNFILNPSSDLPNMETRMKSFFKYWLPDWNGIIGKRPSDKEFINMLTSSEIFTYSGHGSGAQFCSHYSIKKTQIKSVVFLFGCCSTELKEGTPVVEAFGVSQVYLLAACPCIIGMLWVVTDCDTDLLTADLLSSWIPNHKKKESWKRVDHRKWLDDGQVITKPSKEGNTLTEPSLLKALSIAKQNVKFLGNRAAIVARGLPVKLVDKSKN